MNQFTFKVTLLFALFGNIIVLWYLPTYTSWRRQELSKPIILNTQRMYQLLSLYLTQTENCIPTYLKSPEVIGDSEACQCDVIIFSYKNKCTDTSFPHVQYLFNSSKSTTWTVGRNLLYEAARKRKDKYIHYIFMDDDVHIGYKKHTESVEDV